MRSFFPAHEMTPRRLDEFGLQRVNRDIEVLGRYVTDDVVYMTIDGVVHHGRTEVGRLLVVAPDMSFGSARVFGTFGLVTWHASDVRGIDIYRFDGRRIWSIDAFIKH